MSKGDETHQHAATLLRKGQGGFTRRFVSRLLQIGAHGGQPLLFAFGLCIGAAIYITAPFEPDALLIFGISFASILLFAMFWQSGRAPPLVFALCVLLVGVSCGVLSGKLALLRVSHPVITQPMGPVMLEGWVEDVEPAKRGVRLRLIVHAIDDLPAKQLPEKIRVTHTTRLEVEAGRFVRCWVVLRPPPAPIVQGDYAFDRQAYFEGLGAVGYVQGRCRGGALGAPRSKRLEASLWLAKHRRNLAHYVDGAAGERAGGFAAALASGDRSFMAASDQDALRGSGLAHLLAISGLHMGIVGGLVFVLIWRGLALIEPVALRIPVQKPAAAAALLASFTYLMLSGASVSTQRAFIMAAVLFGAVLVDRVALSLRSLAIAMIIVVILSPWSVLTPGFQMSFAATGALIATYEAWQRRRRETGNTRTKGVVFWFKSLVVTSFVSGIATMPFALYHFDRIAGLGLIANLAAMPIISLVSAPAAAAAMLLTPIGLSAYPLRLFGYSLEAVLWVAHTFDVGAAGGSRVGKAMPDSALAALIMALICGVTLIGWRKRAVFGGAFLVAGLATWALAPAVRIHWAPSGEIFLVDQTGSVERFTVVKQDGLAPLRYIDTPLSADCAQTPCGTRLEGVNVKILTSQTIPTCENTRRGELVLSLIASPENLRCQRHILVWDENTAARGRSWKVQDGTITQISKPECGARPWITCTQD